MVDGRNQPGLGATDNSPANQGSPPDTTGAIGPDHYVEMVNSKVAVYARANLGLVALARSRRVHRPAPARRLRSADPVGPAGRPLALRGGEGQRHRQNFLDFGWSKTADPSDLVGGWCRFHLATDVGPNRFLEDYPKLGHDNLHILIGTNSTRGSSFFTAHIYSMPKPANGDTSCTAPAPITAFGSPGSPLTSSDGTSCSPRCRPTRPAAPPAGYVVAADAPYFVASPSQVMAWHVGGTATAPVLVPDGNMNVTPFAFPANVPQPSTSEHARLRPTRASRRRSSHADPSAGGAQAVWTQHTVDGPGGRSVVRWYELLPASLTVRQLGTIQSPSPVRFQRRDLTGLERHHRGDQLQHGQRLAARPDPGAVAALDHAPQPDDRRGGARHQRRERPGLQLHGAHGPPCRWGDYAGASPDPNDSQAIWGSNQLNGPLTSDPAWVTRNFQITDSLAGYVRPKGASPLRVSLVPAYNQCVTPNRTHGAPLSFGSCAPPAQSSSFLTVGTPDANGAPAQGIAWLQMKAVLGDEGTGLDEADVQLDATSTDVRLSSGLGDYTGELQARVDLQVTDRSSGPAGDEPATGQTVSFRFAVPCQATASTSVGSTCTVATTADALAAGTIKESVRTIWQLDSVRLFDGGADGVAATDPNGPFRVAGRLRSLTLRYRPLASSHARAVWRPRPEVGAPTPNARVSRETWPRRFRRGCRGRQALVLARG